jgi:hypothetical protein
MPSGKINYLMMILTNAFPRKDYHLGFHNSSRAVVGTKREDDELLSKPN